MQVFLKYVYQIVLKNNTQNKISNEAAALSMLKPTQVSNTSLDQSQSQMLINGPSSSKALDVRKSKRLFLLV